MKTDTKEKRKLTLERIYELGKMPLFQDEKKNKEFSIIPMKYS